jgi:hypothetical protein
MFIATSPSPTYHDFRRVVEELSYPHAQSLADLQVQHGTGTVEDGPAICRIFMIAYI